MFEFGDCKIDRAARVVAGGEEEGSARAGGRTGPTSRRPRPRLQAIGSNPGPVRTCSQQKAGASDLQRHRLRCVGVAGFELRLSVSTRCRTRPLESVSSQVRGPLGSMGVRPRPSASGVSVTTSVTTPMPTACPSGVRRCWVVPARTRRTGCVFMPNADALASFVDTKIIFGDCSCIIRSDGESMREHAASARCAEVRDSASAWPRGSAL